jgi:hypothetical protein
VGSEYIRDIHFYGRTLGRSFLTIGGKVIHLGEVSVLCEIVSKIDLLQ